MGASRPHAGPGFGGSYAMGCAVPLPGCLRQQARGARPCEALERIVTARDWLRVRGA